jgi:hypothetical protein
MSDDDAQPYSFTARCNGCRKTLAVAGESEDELRELLATSGWQMVTDESMADPISDSVNFLCPDCPVNYLDELP